MTKQQYERLQPFLHRKSARQRIILYLFADGYTVPDLVKMTVPGLHALELPPVMTTYVDEMLENRKNGAAFQYPNGLAIPHTGFYRLMRAAAKRAVGRPMSVQQFRAYMRAK